MGSATAVLDVNQPLGYEDYAAIPADGRLWEVLDGDPHVTPAPSPYHQRTVTRLLIALDAHFASRRGEVLPAPIDVILGPHDICQPDLVVVTDEAQVSARGIEGPPTLVVEVLSPANREYDRKTKSRRYAERGVPHYWIVDPELETVDCYRNADRRWERVVHAAGAQSLRHPDFPGLDMPLGSIWPVLRD